MYKIIRYLAILILFFTTSCKKDFPVLGETAAKAMSNEWWVTLKVGTIDQLGHHYKLSTYNTSANTNEIWVDDLHNGYVSKNKAIADFNAMTFSATNASNEYYNPANPPAAPKTLTIANGKVLVGVGKSKTGNVTDSIYMEAEYSDDPGTKYVISGHARTRFDEDEY